MLSESLVSSPDGLQRLDSLSAATVSNAKQEFPLPRHFSQAMEGCVEHGLRVLPTILVIRPQRQRVQNRQSSFLPRRLLCGGRSQTVDVACKRVTWCSRRCQCHGESKAG